MKAHSLIVLLILVVFIFVVPFVKAAVTVAGPSPPGGAPAPFGNTASALCGAFCNPPMYFIQSNGLLYMFIRNTVLNSTQPMYLYTSSDFGATWVQGQQIVSASCAPGGAFYINAATLTAYYSIGFNQNKFCYASGSISGATITWGAETMVATAQEVTVQSVTADASGNIWTCYASTISNTYLYSNAVLKKTFGSLEACSLYNLNSGSDILALTGNWVCCTTQIIQATAYLSGSFHAPVNLDGGTPLTTEGSQCQLANGVLYCVGCPYASMTVCAPLDLFKYSTGGGASPWGGTPNLLPSYSCAFAYGLTADSTGTDFIAYSFKSCSQGTSFGACSGCGGVVTSRSIDGGATWDAGKNSTIEHIYATINGGGDYSGGGPMMSDGNGTAFWEGYGGASVPTITFSVRMLGVHLPVVIVTQTVIQVVPCNFYQQQCWWEPLIFY